MENKKIEFEDIQKANDTIKTTGIERRDKDGNLVVKNYAEVNQRIKAFRMVYPTGTIETEMSSNENGVVIFRAYVYDNEDRLLATGTAYEKENSTFINKTSYIENCETSAIGRALGIAGFGIDTSGNTNIINGTGLSIDELDQELDNNNPVIIYIIAKFNEPKEVIEGAPRNLHVMLLTGYNKITGDHFIVDPWTHDDGRTSWTVSKKLLEEKYNFVGKKAVIVR